MLEYVITEYLQKYKGLRATINKEAVALGKWKIAEQRCMETNRRFRAWRYELFPAHVEARLHGAQRKIASVLGRLCLPSALADCGWGPGATFDLRREVATVDKKMSHTVSVTAQALPFIRQVIETDPHWAYAFLGVVPEGAFSLLPGWFHLVRGSRFLTVPKSAKTNRCIAAEPTGNGFLQQGVHAYMRRRLKRFGVDLDDQSINQSLARSAYEDGLSTLDLSAASDSISRELVFHLLPLEWALFLDLLRSPETRVKKDWVRTEKFVSMGNAFCFELESLIFWALASSTVEDLGVVGPVSVYGDDIIVPRQAYDSVVEILRVCGFEVNDDKSFKDGNFFESCGKHYHRGRDVTPVYQKNLVKDPSEVVRAHNRLIRLTSRLSPETKIVSEACRSLKKMYQLRPLPRIPQGLEEDGGFLTPVVEFPPPDPNRGFKCRVLDYKPQHIEARADVMYAYSLRRNRLRKTPDYERNARFVDFSQLQNVGHRSPDPGGQCVNATKGKWRTCIRWVPESALTE